jgi:hypothetical protein
MVRSVNGLSFLAPLFLAFEIWQLVISERYLGIKQIARGGNPREMGPSEWVSFFWTGGIVLYGAWMVALLPFPATRAAGLGLLAVTAIGYSLRRNCPLKWVLVVLTFEGAVRIGLLGMATLFALHHHG